MRKIDFKLKATGKKILFGLSVSMVLAMAVGSFALGEVQTPASPQEVGATAGPFTVTGGTQGTNFSYASPVLTIHSGNLTISTTAQTAERIVVDGAATITLAGVNIDRTSETDATAALTITDDATFDVKILLADGKTNILKGKAGDAATSDEGSPGIQKNGSGASIGKLTIGVPSGSAGTGKLQANGGLHAAGIGSGYNKSVSNITIIGGVVTANGGSNGAAIGGGYYGSVSNITITGGEVTATGGYEGAGIGGGDHGNGSNITITGGVVTAYGGQDGSGIGGGKNGNGSNITITGGEVTAIGGQNGAGIGGGYYGNGSNITITGSEVTAKGIYQGAGIGGGNNGNGSDIDITDSEVKEASGGKYASGIGGGYYGDGMNITITNSEVNAIGGYGSAGIGGGWYKTGRNIDIIDSKIMATGGGQSSGAGIGGGGNDTRSSGNKIRGNAVVMVASGGNTKDALEGFDSGNITGGIVFTGIGTTFDSDSRATDVSWDESGTMYGDSVTISQNAEFPANLTIEDGKEITLEAGKTLTISAGATLQNEGTLTVNGTVDCLDDQAAGTTGEVTTKTDFYLDDGSLYNTGYQTYKTSAGVQKYTNLPNPDDRNDTVFNSWFTKPGGPDGGGTKVNEKANVLLNEHNFYEYRSEKHDTTIDQPEHGTVTIDPENPKTGDEVIITVTPEEGYKVDGLPIVKTEDGRIIEVIPTGNPNEYKFIMPDSDVTIEVNFVLISEPTVDPGVKTGDSFAGIAALAILGLATTGAALLRKRK